MKRDPSMPVGEHSAVAVMSLDGKWRIRLSPPIEEPWCDPGSIPIAYDFSREFEVPSSWQAAFGDDPRDMAGYSFNFGAPLALPENRNDRYWLLFHACATDFYIHLFQGDFKHSGNWVPFTFEVARDVMTHSKYGFHFGVLVNRRRPGESKKIGHHIEEGGHITKGFHDVLSMQIAGLWQSVELISTGQYALRPNGIVVHANPNNGAVNVALHLMDGAPFAGRVIAKITSPDGSSTEETFDAPGTNEQDAQNLVAGAESAKPRNRCLIAHNHSGASQSVSPGHQGETSPAFVLPAMNVNDVQRWSPDDPALYTLRIKILEESGRISDEATVRFGFREVATCDGRILLNGEPLFISGILDWGHEPMTIAPAPPEDLVRTRFAALKERGINTVCVCMWYPPQYWYDIADEMGMLVWQEHPIWKSPMRPELMPEYRENFEKFFRMDVNHPSVIIVSATCEHETFDKDLAAWWWQRSGEMLPHILRQTQTSFLHWTDDDQTDLYDEHTYENTGRWIAYMRDVADAIAEKTVSKPFVMGESILYTDWPNTDDLRKFMKSLETIIPREGEAPADPRERVDGTNKFDEKAKKCNDASPVPRKPLENTKHTRVGGSLPLPWWVPSTWNAIVAFEKGLIKERGRSALRNFRGLARRHHKNGRKRQTELFRANAKHAGLIHNHFRDVMICPCGFMDDREVWRFAPGDTRPWLAPAAFTLGTVTGDIGITAGNHRLTLGISNFSSSDIAGDANVRITMGDNVIFEGQITIACPRGDVATSAIEVELPQVETAQPIHITAALTGVEPNAWTLWALPAPPPLPQRIAVYADEPFTDDELAPIFEERAYSAGWGLPVKRWKKKPPVPHELLADAMRIMKNDAISASTSCIITHRLTDPILEWLAAGGTVVHLPSRAVGSMPVCIPRLWGQSPLFHCDGPLNGLPVEALVDLMDCDLHHHWIHAIDSGKLELLDHVQPFIRMVVTHDAKDRLGYWDSLFALRVDKGTLIVNAMDTSTPAGLFMLHRTCAAAARGMNVSREPINVERLRSLLNTQPPKKNAGPGEA